MPPHFRCFIFAAGSYYGLVQVPEPGDLILAADGGYRCCLQEGLSPALLLGDFDSLEELPEHLPKRRHSREKDDTDTLLCIRAGLEAGCREFHLYGCSGGRLDHTLANLQALLFLTQQGAKGFLYAEQETFTAVENGALLLPAQADGLFSVFCLGSDAYGVCIEGGKYPLKDARLTASHPLGISNGFTGQPVAITVREGALLVSWLRL